MLEVKYLRNIAGAVRRDRIRNKVICRRSVNTDMTWRVHRSLLKWFGHMERTDETC